MPLIRQGQPSVEPPSTDPVAALDSQEADVRWRAVRDVSRMPNGTALLADVLARESDGRVREAIFTSLSRTPEGVAVILPYVRSEEAAVRTGALDALRASLEKADDLLAGYLSDPDPDVRLLICDVVRGLPSLAATRLMIELLDREDAVNVCAAAIEVLAEVGEPSALPALDRCARRFGGEAFLVFSARIAAQRISEPRG